GCDSASSSKAVPRPPAGSCIACLRTCEASITQNCVGLIMSTSAIQDLYPDDLAHCFGCGRNNPHGYRLKGYAEGPNLVAHFTPEPHYVYIPGLVYGGLLASLADYHAMATATAADLAESSKRSAPRYLRDSL